MANQVADVLRECRNAIAAEAARINGNVEPYGKEYLETLVSNADEALSQYAASASAQGYGISLIAAERARQIVVEGWTPDHDDTHAEHELSQAAACYALGVTDVCDGRGVRIPLWPWAMEWWKSNDRVRDLAKAGALIAAEIDRLQRSSVLAR